MLKDLEFIVYDYIYVNLNRLVWCTIDDKVTISGPLPVCLCLLANENENEIKKIHEIDYLKLLRGQNVPLIDYRDYTIHIQIYTHIYVSCVKTDPAKYKKIIEVFGDPRQAIYKNLC